ncbi:hypothetical protein HNR77_000033 [Paenibacillus sp. JGP012]|nr:hypothetical protein [Paenibacillus sp. JGP012]
MTNRTEFISMEERINRLNRYLTGGGRLFSSSLGQDALQKAGPVDSEKTANVPMEAMETSTNTNSRTPCPWGPRVGLFYNGELKARRMGIVPEHQ